MKSKQRMLYRQVLTIICYSLILTLPISSFAQDNELWKQSPEQLKKGIEDKHPATYYILASKLFESSEKDEAVFWFYLGQFRYRFHLMANKGKLDPSGDPAMFASLSDAVGRPINEYAFGDVEELNTTLDKVLKWDEEHPNGFTSKKKYQEEHRQNYKGLQRLQKKIIDQADEIRKQRKARGLENR